MSTTFNAYTQPHTYILTKSQRDMWLSHVCVFHMQKPVMGPKSQNDQKLSQ